MKGQFFIQDRESLDENLICFINIVFHLYLQYYTAYFMKLHPLPSLPQECQPFQILDWIKKKQDYNFLFYMTLILKGINNDLFNWISLSPKVCFFHIESQLIFWRDGMNTKMTKLILLYSLLQETNKKIQFFYIIYRTEILSLNAKILNVNIQHCM